MLALRRDTALIIVTPDAVVQDLWCALSDRLRLLELEVIAATSVILRPPLLSALYSHGTFKSPRPQGVSTSWLSYAAAELDSSIAAVVRTPLDIDLAALLDRWKGPSAFGRRRAGDLRSVALAAHRCHSVLHTPDNNEHAARDVGVLFGAATLDEVLTVGLHPRCSFEDLRRFRMRAELREAAHPYDIVIRCILRVGAALAYDHAAKPEPRWPTYLDEVERARNVMSSESPHSAASAWQSHALILADLLPALPQPAGGSVRGNYWAMPELHRMAHALLHCDRYSSDLAFAVESAFDAGDLFLDPWERHTLRVALTYPLL